MILIGYFSFECSYKWIRKLFSQIHSSRAIKVICLTDPVQPGLFYKQPCDSLSEWVSESAFSSVRARELTFWENVHPTPCVMCHVSRVREKKNLSSRVALLPEKIFHLESFSIYTWFFFPDKIWNMLDSMEIFIYSGIVFRHYLLPDKFPTRFRKKSI